jgi:hypothetical protein
MQFDATQLAEANEKIPPPYAPILGPSKHMQLIAVEFRQLDPNIAAPPGDRDEVVLVQLLAIQFEALVPNIAASPYLVGHLLVQFIAVQFEVLPPKNADPLGYRFA